jgi:hypothetical protein
VSFFLRRRGRRLGDGGSRRFEPTEVRFWMGKRGEDVRGSGGVRRGLCGRSIDLEILDGACLRGAPWLLSCGWSLEIFHARSFGSRVGTRNEPNGTFVTSSPPYSYPSWKRGGTLDVP